MSGCKLLFTSLPEPTTTKQRIAQLEALPAIRYQKPVHIYWSKEMIPFIEAQTDADAAMALGLVHAHLRLGQMEFMKRVSSGRISEMAGSSMANIDAIIRTLGLGRAAPEIISQMPEWSHAWMEAYVKGINHYKNNIEEMPYDMVAFNMKNEPWTLEDTVKIARLSGMDINWFALFSLLPQRANDNWPQIWRRFANLQQENLPSLQITPSTYRRVNPEVELLTSWIMPFVRAGSNSIAISAKRSRSGAPLLANDPHLSFTIPNLWMVSGIKSPSFHIVGLMTAGIPVMVLGRNANVSWGGTNMHQYSSDIVDVTGQPLTKETHTIAQRVVGTHKISSRLSSVGPVISDFKLFAFPDDKDFAVRWLGHLPSDEFTAYLRIMKADGWKGIQQALKNYGVPGLNMLFADKDGTIGQLSAAKLPSRSTDFPKDLWVSKAESDVHWQKLLTSDQLPSIINPPSGVVASSNNKIITSPPTRMGWSYPSDDRIRRFYQLLDTNQLWDIDSIQTLLNDSYSHSHHRLNHKIVGLLDDTPLEDDMQKAFEILKNWDGYYRASSKGAYLHHAMLTEFAPEFYDSLGRKDEEKLWWRLTYLPQQLLIDINQTEQRRVTTQLLSALEEIEDYVDDDKHWGDIHKVQVSYIGKKIPYFGRKYKSYTLPIFGGTETIFKTSHAFTMDEHVTSFGSQSRHIVDMGNIDANYFIIFGGQDGRINAQNFDDQVPLWHRGKLINVPLTLEKTRERAIHKTSFK